MLLYAHAACWSGPFKIVDHMNIPILHDGGCKDHADHASWKRDKLAVRLPAYARRVLKIRQCVSETETS
jgi:hypothetical protein